MSKTRQKRIATNSMVSTAKRCRKKFVWRYVHELVPASKARAPSFGSLFHDFMRGLMMNGLDTELAPLSQAWRRRMIEDAAVHVEQVRAMLGFEDDAILPATEEKCDAIAKDATALAEYYRDSVLVPEQGRYRVIWAEQNFSVPLTTRGGRIHPTWRFNGRFDMVLQDLSTGRVVIRDYKTTTRMPADFATMVELDTQPIGYLYAGTYLWVRDRPEATAREVALNGAPDIGDDAPYWPTDLGRPEGFELEVIRKKVPREPPLLKKGGLSKAQNVDTTHDLYLAAIRRHGLNPDDYADVLARLKARGPAFHFRSQVNIGKEEIVRWSEETRMCLEDLRVLELHPERAYRADPMTCQNQYGRRCEYHTLCYGDEEIARADFVKRERHAELKDDDD